MDNTDFRPNPPNWLRFDTFMIKSNQQFVVPEKLKNKPGKLIFFSLGSLSSINVELMKKFINCLADLPHRFIVTKGIHGDQYDLPDNCWGERRMPKSYGTLA